MHGQQNIKKRQVYCYNILRSAHTVYSVIISLYNINWLVFNNREGECLQRGADWKFKCKAD